MSAVTEQEFRALLDHAWNRYRASGRPEAVLEELWHHNQRVLEFVDDLAEGESLNWVDYQLLKTSAILHDLARAEAPPAARAEESSRLAGLILRQMGKNEDFVLAVEEAVLRHTERSPFYEDDARADAESAGPGSAAQHPESRVGQLVYDACTLAIMEAERGLPITVNLGEPPANAVVDLRQDRVTHTEEESLVRLRRAAATLHAPSARRIARQLVEQAESKLLRPASAGIL